MVATFLNCHVAHVKSVHFGATGMIELLLCAKEHDPQQSKGLKVIVGKAILENKNRR